MKRFPTVILAVSLVGLASSCSTFDTSYDTKPVVMGGSQTGLTVRYDPAESKSTEIDEIAVAFCKAYDKKPIRRSKSDFMPNVVYQAYDCVSSMPASDTATFGSASPTTR